MRTIKKIMFTVPVSLSLLSMTTVFAEDAEALAKKLANPVASLISVPFQYNYDTDIGKLDTGSKSFVNIQPVVPISLNEDWNVISRTILPVVWQEDIRDNSGSQSGLGSVVQSFFFSPKAPTENGWIWGVGPVFLLPTATDDLLGGDQWGAGPTGVALKQIGPWTVGGLFNHIWSFADENPTDISSTFLQPFLSHTTPSAVTYSLNTESTYNWKTEEWSVPINATVSKVMKWGNQLVSVGGGVRYWADSTENGPEGWGARVTFTLLFPKK